MLTQNNRNPVSILLLIYFSFQIALLLLTYLTQFNMVGLQYAVNEVENTVSFDQGVFQKESKNIKITKENSLQIMHLALPIIRANNLWEVNIFLIPLLAAGLISLLLFKSKHKKWYTALYVLLLIGMYTWNAATLIEIKEEIRLHSSLLEEA